jgi:TIR domain
MPWSGDEWRKRIDEAIAGTTFFIPIVTPKYFLSEECRRELIQFTTKAKNLGLGELLLSVYYVDVPELNEDEPEDEAMALIKQAQWVDWRDHRLADPHDAAVRKAVNDMARRRASISERVARVPDNVPTAPPDQLDEAEPGEDEGPGLVDRLARGEEAIPKMGEALEALGEEVNRVGELMTEATAEVEAADNRGGGFAPRLKIARDLAKRLDPHAEAIHETGRDYGAALVDADPAVDTLFGMIEESLAEGRPPLTQDERQEALELLLSAQEMASNSAVAMASLKQFITSLDELGTLSRDIRRPTSRMRKGLQGLVDGQAVIDEWARRANHLQERISPTDEGGQP